jgi:hypothetical protein
VLDYPQTIVVTRPSGTELSPAQDPDAGVFDEASPLVIFAGAADVQDVGSEKKFGTESLIWQNSDALVFLEDESGVNLIRTKDLVRVTFQDSVVRDARVTRITKLDGKFGVRYL